MKNRACLFSVMTSKIDIWQTPDIDIEFAVLKQSKQYEQVNKVNDSMYELQIKDNEYLYVCRYGILILAEIFDLSTYGEDAEKVLKWKESVNGSHKNNREERSWQVLNEYGEFYSCKDEVKSMFNDKVHYTLICYVPSFENLSGWDSHNKQVYCLWLMTKTKPNEADVKGSLQHTLKNSNVKIIDIDEHDLFATIWGARMICCKESDEHLLDYMKIEACNQSMWLLISSMNEYIDKTVKSDENSTDQLFEIIERVYDVLFYEAEFKYINAKTSHRYQLEIQKLLFEISNLDTMSVYFKEKAELLERKIKMVSEQEEKESNDNLNFVLNVLTIVSSVSAVFQITDYLINSPKNTIWSMLANIVITVPLIVTLLIKNAIKKRKKQHK